MTEFSEYPLVTSIAAADRFTFGVLSGSTYLTRCITGANLATQIGSEFPDGTAAAPSITFLADDTTGFYRIGSSNIGMTLGGVLKYNFSTTNLTIPGTLTFGSKVLTVSNSLTFTGTDSSSVAFGAGGTVLYNGGALGTPSSGVATNLTGTASGLTAGHVTTNANLTGDVTSVGNATTIGAGKVTNSMLAGSIDLTSKVTGLLPLANGGTGVVTSNPIIQQVRTIVSASATGTTTIPLDNSIPQNTEGDEYMTLAITPKNAANILVIEVQGYAAISVSTAHVIMALFQDSTAGALSAISAYTNSSGAADGLQIKYYMTAGTTSSTTFRVRMGANTAATTTFNGSAGTRLFGGVANSYITITEYSA